MPKDFDQDLDQDLSFRIGGQDFTMRYVRPEVLASWEVDIDETKSDEALKRLDERISAFLSSDDDRARYAALRADEEHALPLVKINELLTWMVEVQTSRPTQQPSVSAVGRGKTAPSSKAE